MPELRPSVAVARRRARIHRRVGAPRRGVRLAAGLATVLGLACEPEAPPAADSSSATPPARARSTAPDGAAHAAIAGDAPIPEPDATADEPLRLVRPPVRSPADVGRYAVTPSRPTARVAQAYQFDAPVYHLPNAARRVIGLTRRNTRLAVDRWVPGDGCDRSWYALLGGGYVCSSDGYAVSADPALLTEALRIEPPAVDQALPYRYAKVKTPAPLYWRLPTPGELASGSAAPVREQAEGAHFVALDQATTVGEEAFGRTVRGFYVRERDLEPKPAPTMHGELLSGADALPLAFVYKDDAPLFEPGSSQRRGTAERFARFAVQGRTEHDGEPRVLARDGFAVAARDVRVLRARARPEEVGPDEQWIHVDLDQQTLVAYEGDRPVLATLVASGKEGFEPPLGLFPIHKKYTTVTMSGPDPDAGTYAVEQVPWTMYYWGSYALHGAYWHDEFGDVRSHGCTNIPPVDARWLFYWSEPSLPTGWHAKVGIKGPKVWFTRGPAPGSASRASP